MLSDSRQEAAAIIFADAAPGIAMPRFRRYLPYAAAFFRRAILPLRRRHYFRFFAIADTPGASAAVLRPSSAISPLIFAAARRRQPSPAEFRHR